MVSYWRDASGLMIVNHLGCIRITACCAKNGSYAWLEEESFGSKSSAARLAAPESFFEVNVPRCFRRAGSSMLGIGRPL